jgi:hypothetical protein
MACVHILKSKPQGRMLYYNLEGSVGPGCLNRPSDLLLVQYFLREAFKGGKPPGPPLVVTGTPNQATFDAIIHYQKAVKAKGKNISTDGRIDPAQADQTHGSISGTQYTILFLNISYRDVRPKDFCTLDKASDCPAGLKEDVKIKWLESQ